MIDLRGATKSGEGSTHTVGETWTEFRLASWCRLGSVQSVEDCFGAIDCMGAGAEEPQDGQPVGTHRYRLYAKRLTELFVRDARHQFKSGSLFVAAQPGVGTSEVTVIQEA